MTSAATPIEIKDIYAALQRIRKDIPHTPLQKSASLSELCQCEVYVKFENLQRTGSFKERGALNKLLEIPAGLVEPGEDPLETAHRELREETGFDAEEMLPLGRFYSSPGFCNEEILLFRGRGLRPDPRPQDDDEQIELCPVSRKEVVRRLREGELTDGKTLVALYRYLENEDLLPFS